jgi:hypothetical protein
MNLFKIIFSISISAAVFTLGTGCKPEPTPEPTPVAPREEVCYMETYKTGGLNRMKIDYNAEHNIGRFYYFKYDGSTDGYLNFQYSNGKVSSYTAYNEAEVVTSNTEIIYNSNGKILQRNMYVDTELKHRTEYIYDAAQRLIRQSNFSINFGITTPNEYIVFDYASAGEQLVKESEFDGQGRLSYIRELVYDNNHNQIKITHKSSTSTNYYVVINTFDNHKAATVNFGGLHTSSVTGANYSPYNTSAGKNNVLTSTFTQYDNLDNIVSGSITNYTYEHDSKDNPIKQISTVSNQAGTTMNTFTYHCH